MRLSLWQEEINYHLQIQPGSFCRTGKGEGWRFLRAKITQNNPLGKKKKEISCLPQPSASVAQMPSLMKMKPQRGFGRLTNFTFFVFELLSHTLVTFLVQSRIFFPHASANFRYPTTQCLIWGPSGGRVEEEEPD